MNSPRIPTPDPQGVVDFAETVLGIQLAEWQRQHLITAVVAFGYAAVASSETDDEEERPGPLAAAGEAIRSMAQSVVPPEMRKGYNSGPAPQHSATPIGDTVGPDPRKS